jgi:Zn-dependent peptidase ImmA (M78 family)
MNQIKYLKFADYRIIANSFIKKVGMHKIKTLPLNIELMIEKAGHHIIPIANLKRDFGAKGVVIKTASGYDIGIDLEHYTDQRQKALYPFTLGEEMAHILIHLYLFDKVTCRRGSVNIINGLTDEDYSVQEQQARNIATCLILPAHIFDRFVIDYVSKNINDLRKLYFSSKEDFSSYLSSILEKELNLSKFVINFVILKRHPDVLIDKILSTFGNDIVS